MTHFAPCWRLYRTLHTIVYGCGCHAHTFKLRNRVAFGKCVFERVVFLCGVRTSVFQSAIVLCRYASTHVLDLVCVCVFCAFPLEFAREQRKRIHKRGANGFACMLACFCCVCVYVWQCECVGFCVYGSRSNDLMHDVSRGDV